MEEKKFNLILSDSITAMKLLIENGTKVDMILCDLPYGTTSCSWDVVIPFTELWDCYKQLIKPNGAIVLFGSQPFTTDLIMSNREWFKYEIIWEKPNPSNPLLAKKQPMKNLSLIHI
jgi:site-specific DNA-methyltransferase (adenine-specific)